MFGIDDALIGGLVSGGLGLLGSSMQSNAAQNAAQTSANAQLQAAQIAADAQKFRPVGITTRFGTSNFTTDANGNLTNAGYTVSPELKAIQDQLLSQAGGSGTNLTGQGLGAAQSLFNLGKQYLATSPEQAAQDWMAKQQAVLQPGRDVALSGIRQNLFNTGRGGLSVAQGGDLGAANPELQAYYNSLAQQNNQLAANAQEQGRAATQFGAGLFGSGAQAATAGYSPLQTSLGLAGTVENLGQNALDLGSALGGRVTAANTNAANTLLSSGINAAKTLQAANQYSPYGAALTGLASNNQLTSGFGNWLSGLNTPALTAASSTGGWGTGNYFGNQDLGAYL